MAVINFLTIIMLLIMFIAHDHDESKLTPRADFTATSAENQNPSRYCPSGRFFSLLSQ